MKRKFKIRWIPRLIYGGVLSLVFRGIQFPVAISMKARFEDFRGLKIGKGSSIRANCMIGKNVVIGSNSYIGDYSFVDDNVEIGDDVYLGRGVEIITQTYQSIEGKRAGELYLSNGIAIEGKSWIGSKAIILPRVKRIGKSTIIAAGSVVVKEVGANCLVAGNPAVLKKVLES